MKEYNPKGGAFHVNLTKSNTKIREGRAEGISEDLFMTYKRRIEDTAADLRNLERELVDMLDLHPDTAFGLRIASEFNANEFVAKRLDLVVKIRNLKIRLALAEQDFASLFSPELANVVAAPTTHSPSAPVFESPLSVEELDAELNPDFDPLADQDKVDGK